MVQREHFDNFSPSRTEKSHEKHRWTSCPVYRSDLCRLYPGFLPNAGNGRGGGFTGLRGLFAAAGQKTSLHRPFLHGWLSDDGTGFSAGGPSVRAVTKPSAGIPNQLLIWQLHLHSVWLLGMVLATKPCIATAALTMDHFDTDARHQLQPFSLCGESVPLAILPS